MIKIKPVYLFLFIGLTLLIKSSIIQSQIIFPNGKLKKINTSLDIIYEETKIPFVYHYGIVTNLSWRLLFDTIPKDWFVMACMNGTCLGGVPLSGNFENLTELPDSIGFLKYHFDFKNVMGKAIIKFIIYNPLLFNDAGDTATFDVTYHSNNAVENSNMKSAFTAFPNPSYGSWTIYNYKPFLTLSAKLYDISGHPIATDIPYLTNQSLTIDNHYLSPGIYFLEFKNDCYSEVIRLVKN